MPKHTAPDGQQPPNLHQLHHFVPLGWRVCDAPTKGGF